VNILPDDVLWRVPENRAGDKDSPLNQWVAFCVRVKSRFIEGPLRDYLIGGTFDSLSYSAKEILQ
jgi:hypothetical protein